MKAEILISEYKLQIEQVVDSDKIPFHLLELADPSRKHIREYLKTGACYVAKLGFELVGVVVLNKMDDDTNEIKNIAVAENHQGRGFGKALLRYAAIVSRQSGFKKLVIGTGNSSLAQLALYQKEGFELVGITKDYFINRYHQPIFENGIQCKHMLVLERQMIDKSESQERNN